MTEKHKSTDSANSKAASNKGSTTNVVNSAKTESSGEGKDKSTEVRANFSRASPFDSGYEEKTKPQTSPLLSSTPPTVAKSLVRSYPYLLIVNKLLSIITWTNDDYWINVIIVSAYAMAVMYFEKLVTWFGHLIVVGLIALYALLNQHIIEETNLHPTLDDVVQALTTTSIKADMLLNPITTLSLSAYEIKRLLFTTVFLTPVYLIITFFLISPRSLLLFIGLHVLTYHSSYSRVTRKMLWKIKVVRILCFYLTGLDFSKAKNHSLFAAAFAKVQKNAGHSFNLASETTNKPVRFTYVIYENQRRWLGIGWTSNLLSYERAPWTDEFLNESSSIDTFQLPNSENMDYSFGGSEQSSALSSSGASWRWVDKTWRLDLTNDGAITLPNNKRSKTTADPSPDEGYIYYDNTWKKPSTEDSFSKYTRRRRWIRTAELVFNEPDRKSTTEENTSSSVQPTETKGSAKKRKSLRFADSDADAKKTAEVLPEPDLGEKPANNTSTATDTSSINQAGMAEKESDVAPHIPVSKPKDDAAGVSVSSDKKND
ncbi:Piso0_000846 [Millerozyma farinosa CBS 7064]|uniref:Piso0_000846 protein n=1 Tax=Pichia sorbitophila (strain ATCC MYA-4447 / BCRC 22081 / CBS 7064 / NBRC 10061 / NRRL Y-12695) TaxID=559304 RepID=G8YRP2_PICSO|nr:Piso0_000846 [Millerozyma farinosa CBS 7064]